MQGLTAKDDAEKAIMLRQLLASQCGNGLMHESVNVNSPQVSDPFSSSAVQMQIASSTLGKQL